METAGPTAIEIILWVVAANVLLVVSAYGLSWWWNRKAQATLEQVAREIEEHLQRLEEIFGFLDDYRGIRQAPFVELLHNLQKEASELQIQIEHLREASQRFEEQMHGRGPNRLQEIINAPFDGFRRWRKTLTMTEESVAIRERFEKVHAQTSQIYELPWELALQCRQAQKDAAELEEFVSLLQSKNVQGQGFQEVLDQLGPVRQSLSSVPVLFFQAEHDALLASAEREATIQVFHTLARIRPSLEKHLPQARDWHTHHQKATSEFAELKQKGATLRQALTHSPEGLVIAPLQTRLDQVAQTAADLNQRLARPTVEHLKPLSREVSLLNKVVQDTEQQFQRASRQIAELDLAIAEEHANFEKMAAQLAGLESNERLPMTWDESGPVLMHLRQRLQAIGPAQQPRTPDQLAQHLKDIESLRAEFRPLTEKQPRILEQHRTLLALLNSPELHEGAAWLRKTREMLVQASLYDPRNWPKQDSVQTLLPEMEELSRQQEQLVHTGQALAIQESKLSTWLKDTQQLQGLHKALRPRAENIRARFEKIQVLETEGKQKLTGAYGALERMDLLTESNQLLESIALEEIDRLLEELRQLGNELNAQNQGEVEKKVLKINALSEKVARSLNLWLGRLNTAIAEQGKQIGNWLVQLDTAGILDDAPIQQARNLLARDEFTNALQNAPAAPNAAVSPAQRGAAVLKGAAARLSADRKTTLGELEATAEIKRKNDFWQNLLAAEAAIEALVDPLLVAYQETIEAREETRETLAEVMQQTPNDRRGWPPSNQAALTENQTMQPVDKKWDDLKKQHTRIEDAMRNLRRLAQEYRLVTERMRQVQDRIKQDQERIQDLEWQIEDLKQRWLSQAQADPNNPIIGAGVQQLMSQADSRLAFIKHQYMRGAVSYEDVVHHLRSLYDDLFAARISVDDRTDIGLSEKHRRAAPSNGRSR